VESIEEKQAEKRTWRVRLGAGRKSKYGANRGHQAHRRAVGGSAKEFLITE
jgi:hypothetical protein